MTTEERSELFEMKVLLERIARIFERLEKELGVQRSGLGEVVESMGKLLKPKYYTIKAFLREIGIKEKMKGFVCLEKVIKKKLEKSSYTMQEIYSILNFNKDDIENMKYAFKRRARTQLYENIFREIYPENVEQFVNGVVAELTAEFAVQEE